MPARSATSRKWFARALHAGRAAAFLTTITGVNLVLAEMYPRYEPIYAYLITIVLVAWLASSLIGVTAAVAAAVIYDTLFGPLHGVTSISFAVPLTIAVAVAVATRAARLPLRDRPVLAEPVQPQLLAVPAPPQPAPPPRVEVIVDETRIHELEEQLADAELRADGAESRQAQLTNEIDRLRQQILEHTGRFTLARREADALAERLTAAEARAAEESTRADRESRLREQLADVSAKHDEAIAEAKQRADTAAKRAEALQTALTNERARASQQAAEYAAALGASKQRAEAAIKRVEALQTELSNERTRADRQGGAYASAVAERQKLNEAAAEEVRALQDELDRANAALEAERERADREASLRSQMETAARETLNRTAVVSAAHQRDAEEAREAARAAEERVRDLQRQLEQETLRVTFESAARQKVADDLASVRREIESARADAEAAQNALRDAQQKIGDDRERSARMEFEWKARLESQKDDLNREFDAKLDKIVKGLAEDHENAVGDALLEREAAKAEVRRLTQKSEALQRRIDEERVRAEQEKAARERLDAEWNVKLEKIVAHLTEDHESDVGEAMLQREAAKAEVRTLNAKVAALQKQIEDDREKFHQFATRRTSPTAPTVEQKIPTTPLSRPRVVLVVHSDAGVRAMTKHTLQQSGYIVLTAADGLEGLRTATQQKPEVVLTEAKMPKMNARELVQLLKSKRETADVKIILIAADGDVGRASDFTADEIVRNPADFNELRTALTHVLARGVTS